MGADLHDHAHQVAAEDSLTVTLEEVGNIAPIAFDEKCLATLRRAATSLNHQHLDLISGVGHDAFWISKVAPSAMIMCTCVDGLSYNEAEEITPDWASASAEVSCHAVLEMAEIHKAG